MSTTPVNFKDSTTLSTSLAAVYTSPASTTSIIKQVSIHNYSLSSAELIIQIVPSGEATGNSRQQIRKTLSGYETYSPFHIVGLTLEAGDAVYASSSAASSLNFTMSGNQIT